MNYAGQLGVHPKDSASRRDEGVRKANLYGSGSAGLMKVGGKVGVGGGDNVGPAGIAGQHSMSKGLSE